MGAVVRRFLLVVLLVFAFLPVPAAVSAGCSAPKGIYVGATPWAQKLVDAPRVWPLSTGAGVTVAVVGTGVDGANAQFAPGQVLPEINLLPGGGGVADCDGRGTFAAGIVGAQVNPNTTFAGVAPGARILPVKYTQSTSSATQGGDPNALATAISRAAIAGAKVILVVVPAGGDSPALDAAVAQAVNAGDVVVSPAVSAQQGGLSYPTASSHLVVSVGAVNASGAAVSGESGDVDLAGPGADLVSTSAGAGGKLGLTWPVQDPSFAAAYVAGSVALLRSYVPGMTPNQVMNRLTLTASRVGGGQDGRLGWGVLDAYAAVTSELPVGAAGPGASVAGGTENSVMPASAPRPGDSPYWWAGVIGLLGVVVAGLVVLGAVTARRGKARGWRLGRVVR